MTRTNRLIISQRHKHNRKSVVRGTPLRYNASLQAKYRSELTVLVRKMMDETKKSVIKLFEGRTAKKFYVEQEQMAALDASITSQAKQLAKQLTAKFEQLFSEKAPLMAQKMVENSGKMSNTGLKSSLKKISDDFTLKNNLMTGGLREVTKAVVAENVSLIKSIASEYLSGVQETMMRSITTGGGLELLIPELEKHDGITHRRAKNIALDQTRKAYNAVNKGRMEAVGVKKFEWLHSGGGQHPREDHMAMSGNIYSFDDLPIINKKTGERGIPGQAINCKCVMIPVITLEPTEED